MNSDNCDLPAEASGWSAVKKKAYKQRIHNPNTYYYRFNEDGEEPKTGPWSAEEKRIFMERLEEMGGSAMYNWGLFSKTIQGRVGYQCAALYRKLVKEGEIVDDHYKFDENGKLLHHDTPAKRNPRGPSKSYGKEYPYLSSGKGTPMNGIGSPYDGLSDQSNGYCNSLEAFSTHPQQPFFEFGDHLEERIMMNTDHQSHVPDFDQPQQGTYEDCLLPPQTVLPSGNPVYHNNSGYNPLPYQDGSMSFVGRPRKRFSESDVALPASKRIAVKRKFTLPNIPTSLSLVSPSASDHQRLSQQNMTHFRSNFDQDYNDLNSEAAFHDSQQHMQSGHFSDTAGSNPTGLCPNTYRFLTASPQTISKYSSTNLMLPGSTIVGNSNTGDQDFTALPNSGFRSSTSSCSSCSVCYSNTETDGCNSDLGSPHSSFSSTTTVMQGAAFGDHHEEDINGNQKDQSLNHNLQHQRHSHGHGYQFATLPTDLSNPHQFTTKPTITQEDPQSAVRHQVSGILGVGETYFVVLPGQKNADGTTMGALYLGNGAISANLAWLRHFRIETIINCTTEIKNYFSESEECRIRYQRIPLEDQADANLSCHFKDSSDFIQQELDSHRSVLIHCKSGYTRSICIAISYLMHHKRMNLEACMNKFRVLNVTGRLNDGFKRALMALEQQLFDGSQSYDFFNTESMQRKAAKKAVEQVWASSAKKARTRRAKSTSSAKYNWPLPGVNKQYVDNFEMNVVYRRSDSHPNQEPPHINTSHPQVILSPLPNQMPNAYEHVPTFNFVKDCANVFVQDYNSSESYDSFVDNQSSLVDENMDRHCLVSEDLAHLESLEPDHGDLSSWFPSEC